MLTNTQAKLGYSSLGVKSNREFINPTPIDLSDLRYSNDAIIHQLTFWEDSRFPDDIYLKRFDRMPYHLAIKEFDEDYPGSRRKNLDQAFRKKERALGNITPLVKPIESFNNRPTVVNYSHLFDYYQFKGTKAVANLIKYEAVLSTLVAKVREIGRISDKLQYVYLNISLDDHDVTEYSKLLKLSPSRLSTQLNSFEDYMALKVTEWIVYGSGPLRRLGSVSDVFIIIKSKARGYLYLSNMIQALVQGTDTDIASEYRIRLSGAIDEGLRLRAVKNIFNNVKSSTVSTASVTLDDDGEMALLEPPVEPLVITKDVDVSAPKTEEEYLAHIEEDLSAEPITVPADIKRFQNAVSKNSEITLDDKPLVESMVIPESKKALKQKVFVKDDNIIGNKGMGESVLPNLDKDYIEHGANAHMLKVLNAFKPSGLVLVGVTRDEIEDITGGYVQYKANFVMANGGASTEIIRVPMIDKEGFYTTNNVKYRMRRQAVDHPIRKIGAKRTELTSYYGTLMVDGPTLAVDDKIAALSRKLKPLELLSDYNIIRNNVYDPRLEVNDLYSRLAMEFELIEFKKLKISLNFNYQKEYAEAGRGFIRVGNKGRSSILLKDETFYIDNGKTPTPVGDMFDLLELEMTKKPIDVATLNILGTRVYVGVMLAYLYGLTKLLKRLSVKTTIYPINKRVDRPVEPNILLKFKNGQLLITELSKTAEMILQGLVKYQDKLKLKNFAELDSRDSYLDITSKDLQVRHIREFNLIDKQFIDPITEEVLEYLGHPTWFRDLLIKAVDHLNTNHWPSSADARFTRYRGYERLAGAAYAQIAKHLRVANNAINRKQRRLGMSPYAVWQMIQEDDSNKTADETNPLGWMKEQEAVTVSGMNGRTSGTLTMEVRKYHPSMVGTISEFVPDDGNVGMVSYLTANPRIDNIYGIPSVIEGDINKEYARNYSSGFNFMANIISDDNKRVSFASIQNTHTIAMERMELPYVRSGYEFIIPHRVGKTFCQVAPEDGKVIKSKKFGLTVEYKSGKKDGFTAGIVFGKAEGTLYPSNLVTNLKDGDTFKEGDPIVWNDKFFEYDMFAKRLGYRHTQMATLALLEGEQTYEDSCSCSNKFVDGISSKVAKLRSIRVNFGDIVHNVLPGGEFVRSTDYLMIVQEAATAGLKITDADLKASLSNLTQNAPKAKYDGKIDRIEVFYNGDIGDMSESLRTLAETSDKELKQRARESGRKQFTGAVTSNYRSEGKTLNVNEAEIRVYVEVTDNIGNSDKIVFAHQLKTTVGEIEVPTVTEHGIEIDVKFSRIAVDARIVGSFDEIAILGTCLDLTPPKIEELWNK